MVITINLKYFLILLLFTTTGINTFKLFDLFNFNGKSAPKDTENSSIVQIELLNGTEETTTILPIEEELVLTTEVITNDISHNESTSDEIVHENNHEAITNTSDYDTNNLTHLITNITDIDTNNNNLNKNVTVSESMYSNETITPTINEEQLFVINENSSNSTSTITTIDANESSGQQCKFLLQKKFD
uniref:Uncharacterized protein n=1 Tax=Strongyloides papillosus TaxID=174720 RepID=A0A0N5BQ57_STREA